MLLCNYNSVLQPDFNVGSSVGRAVVGCSVVGFSVSGGVRNNVVSCDGSCEDSSVG